MKYLIIIFFLLILNFYKKPGDVCYENLSPAELSAKIKDFPVAYLPLGTLEWHGEHLPLGTDAMISKEFFKKLAYESGGIVLPPLFWGPDIDTILNGVEYYGMELGNAYNKNDPYGPQILTGNAYWVSNLFFDTMINNIMQHLSRNGFKIVVAHGHGPSTNYIKNNAHVYKEKYGLIVLNCWSKDSGDLCIMCDHAAANETSLMMYLCPDLVEMKRLPEDPETWPLAIRGKDPRLYASKKKGKEIVDFQIKRMSTLIKQELNNFK